MPIVALLSLSLSNVALVLLAFKAAEKPAAHGAAPTTTPDESEISDPGSRLQESGRRGHGAAGGAGRARAAARGSVSAPSAKGESRSTAATPPAASLSSPIGGLGAVCGAQVSPARDGPVALKAPDDTRVEMLRGSGGEPAAPSPVQEEVGERDAE